MYNKILMINKSNIIYIQKNRSTTAYKKCKVKQNLKKENNITYTPALIHDNM
jgi:hypothetical protein